MMQQFKYRYYFLCALLLLCVNVSNAKGTEIDSLKKALSKTKVDSVKADVIYNIAQYYNVKGNYNESIKYFNELISLHKKLKNNFGIAEAYNNIGLIYEKQGNYAKAIEIFFNSLKTWEKLDDKYNVISAYINIALIYVDLGKYDKALGNCEKALALGKLQNDKRYLGYCYNTFGIVYYYKGEYKKTLEGHLNALKLRMDVGDKVEISATYNNLGIVYVELAAAAKKNGDVKLANEYYDKAMQNYIACKKIAIALEDKAMVAMVDLNIGVLNTILKNLVEAKKQVSNAHNVFMQIGSKEGLKESFKALYDIDSITGQTKDAYFHYVAYTDYRDSLLNDENTRKTAQMQMQYDFDKKESIQKAEQDKADAIGTEEIRVQKTIRYALTVGLVLLLILVVVVFKSYKEKQEVNNLLAQKNQLIETQKIEVEQKNEELNQQNEEISSQRDELEKQKQLVDEAFEKLNEKNKEVMDSIKYASRIQQALLPSEKYFEKHLTRLNQKS